MWRVENRLRVEAQQNQKHDQQQHDEQLAQRHPWQFFCRDFALRFTEVRPVQHRQWIHWGEDQTKSGNHRNHRHDMVAAEQDHKFANEVTGTRHPQRRDGEEHWQRRQPLNFAPQTAHLTHVAGMQTLVQLTTQNEQTGRGQTVCNHLNHRALVRQLAAGIDGNQHEAHVGHGGVGNQTFNIVLGKRHPRAVENTNNAQPHRDRRELGGSIREQRQREAQQTVGRGFQQNPRQVNGTSGRCLRVRVRQPAVQRNHRHFHREGDEEAEHQQIFHAVGHRGLQQILIVEGPNAGRIMVHEHQRQDGNQHHQTARLGIDEELGGRRDTRFTVGGFMAPKRDQEVHRHQHHLPEEEEQEHVDGQEHADNAAQDPHQIEVEEALVFLDFIPGTEHRQHAQQTGQHHHQQRQAVDSKVDSDPKTRDPRQDELRLPLRQTGRLREWVAALQPQLQAKRQRQSHGNQRYPARHLHAKAFGLPAEETANKGNQY